MRARSGAAATGLVVVVALLAGGTGMASAPPSCNKATGDALEKRLPVGPFNTRRGQTLCFDFTGDGRRDIVFTGWEFANSGAHYWAAFRARGGGWTSVIFKRDCCRVRRATRLRIARSGATVVVSQPIYRKADSGCCPTGGTRTGRWRWNGVTLRLAGTSDTPR